MPASKRRQRTLFKRVASILVPVVVFVIVGAVSTNAYIAYKIVHPLKRPVLNSPLGFEQILQEPLWDEKSWPGGGGQQIAGWLMYRDRPAPFVIATHGYEGNREDILSPSFELWKAGYNVLAYDLRAHGESAAETSSLGPAELDDMVATIAYAKTLKSEKGTALCDGRIGLFGIDLGGYVALAAGAADPSVKAIAVDNVYPTQDDFVKQQSKVIFGGSGPPDSTFVEGSFMQSFVRPILGQLVDGGSPVTTASESLAKLADRRVLFIEGKSNAGKYALAERVSSAAPSFEKVEFDRSRSGDTLVQADAAKYDAALVKFFTSVPDFAPPSLDPKAAAAKAAPAAAAPAPAAPPDGK